MADKPAEEPTDVPAEVPEEPVEAVTETEQHVADPVPETVDEPPAETPVETEAPAEPVVPEAAPKVKRTKPKWFFGAVAAGLVLVVAGSAYGYLGVYMQTPENIWKTSLKNTRQGLKAYADKGPSQKKGLKLNGSFKMTLPVPADGSLSGSIYETSSDIKFDAGTSGLRANVEVRTLPVSGSQTPDVYLNVSGIKGLAGLVSQDPDLNATIDSLDGKWLTADHTLIDQIFEAAGSSTPSDIAKETPEQVTKDVQDIGKKLVTVINDRLLSDDASKAVVVIKDKLAKEDFKGRKSQHLRVQIQKTQLHDFAVAMKDALKDSKAKEWLLSGDTTQTFEEALGFDQLLKSIDGAKYDKAIADVWVDTELKTIRDVRIYDKPGDTKSYVDFMFDYKGGDDYPFQINVVADDTSGSQNISLGATINRVTDKVSYTIAGTGLDKTGKKTIDITASLQATPTDEKTSVVKPEGATNIVNLIGGFLGQIQDVQNQLKVVNPVNSSFLDDTELQ